MTPTVEKSPANVEAGNAHGSEGADNARLADHEVTWDSPDDPENPYNWPSHRKITVAVVCSASQLVTTMSASGASVGVTLIAMAMAIEFGIYTLVLSTFASLWITRYDQSETASSLHYIAIALGAFACAQVGGRLMDFMWRRTTAAQPDQEPTPEYRIPYIVTGFIPAVAGLFWYAWSAQSGSHWAVVDVGIFCFTCGAFMFAQGMTAYLVDEFTSTRAASASAATRLWTYILGFIFPIFAPQLYKKLGYGWGNSLLAFLFVALGAPIVLIIWL
ncbi:MFS multidrug transporter [Ilyonectria robusta]